MFHSWRELKCNNYLGWLHASEWRHEAELVLAILCTLFAFPMGTTRCIHGWWSNISGFFSGRNWSIPTLKPTKCWSLHLDYAKNPYTRIKHRKIRGAWYYKHLLHIGFQLLEALPIGPVGLRSWTPPGEFRLPSPCFSPPVTEFL